MGENLRVWQSKIWYGNLIDDSVTVYGYDLCAIQDAARDWLNEYRPLTFANTSPIENNPRCMTYAQKTNSESVWVLLDEVVSSLPPKEFLSFNDAVLHFINRSIIPTKGPDYQRYQQIEDEKKRAKEQLIADQQEAERLAKLKEDEEKAQKLEAERQARIKAEEQETLKKELERQARLREIRENAERLANEERERLISERAKLIHDFCQEHQITTLVHFTHIRNLENILKYGLLSRQDLLASNNETAPVFNDNYRWDGRKDAICLSVSFPNYMLFNKLSNQNRSEWVVLLLGSNILWELDCAFCRTNAASLETTKIAVSERKRFEALNLMFSDYGETSRTDLQIPDFLTTNPQAEILVFEPVNVGYINTVCFYTHQALQSWNGKSKMQFCTFTVNPDYFSPRKDWKVWQKSESPNSGFFDVPPNFDEDIIF